MMAMVVNTGQVMMVKAGRGDDSDHKRPGVKKRGLLGR